MLRRLLLLSVICAFTFFAGLGRPAITESDEAFYAEAGREMVERGDWLTPHFNYEVRFQKPILYYWIVAASYMVGGVGEAAARFGSALSGLGLALLTFAIGRRMYDEEVGVIAGAIAATSFGYFAVAHLSLPDLPLTFFITLATWSAFRALDRPRAWGPLLTFALASALGVLTKGPLGLLLPLLVVVPAAFIERRLRAIAWTRLLAAAAVFAIVAVPWYAAMTWTHGAEYLRGFLIGDNVERFATARYNDPRDVWFYVPIVAGGLVPWTPFAVLFIHPAWQWLRRRLPLDFARGARSSVEGRSLSREEWRLVAWVLLPLLFFTVSIGKQPRYVLPILPPLAILLARAIESGMRAAAPARGLLLVRAAALVSALSLLLVGVSLSRLAPLLAGAGETPLATPLSLAVMASTALAGLVVLFAAPRAIVPALTAAATLTLTAVQFGLLSSPQADAVKRVTAAIRHHRRGAEPVGAYNTLVRNLVFYTRLPQAGLYDSEQARNFLRSPDRVLCVLLAQDAADYQRDGERFVRLAEFRYLDTAKLKAYTVLAPDPTRDLTTVVLVANRD